MPENISISKVFLERLLKPVNKITENCVLRIDKTGIYSICSSIDGVILYARCEVENNSSTSKRINLISIKKFLSGLECLGDENEFKFEFDSNVIKCSNKTGDNEFTEFKYHLVDDSIIKECAVDIDKISNLNFDTEFTISAQKIRQLMQGYSFASDSNKIYFYTENSGVFSEINDKSLQNIDTIKIKICDSFIGDPIETSIPISTEIFRNLTSCKDDIKVKLNKQFKVFVFQNKKIDIDLKYIVSALVK
jgi:hypothetical protein